VPRRRSSPGIKAAENLKPSFDLRGMTRFSTLIVCGSVASAAECRDRWTQPFAVESIWNWPLGANASYVPAGIYTGFNASWGCALRVSAPSRRRACPGVLPNATESQCISAGCCYAVDEGLRCFKAAGGPPDGGFHADQDVLVRGSSDDPPTPFLDRAWVSPPHCCDPSGPQRALIPFPADFVTDCELNNNAAALLLGDNVTLLQFQPLYRGYPGSPFMAQWPGTSLFQVGFNQSIFGNGSWGAHVSTHRSS
jgi:hypothetical protein